MAGIRARVQQAMAEGGSRAAIEEFMRGIIGDDFYDRFFKPGAYLRTHAQHIQRWHGGPERR
jgi:hypothetical protein